VVLNVYLLVLRQPSASEALKPSVHTWAPFECSNATASVLAQKVVAGHRKGLAIDDATWDWCPGKIPVTWPATDSAMGNRVGYVRLFRPSSASKDGLRMLKKFLAYNSAKALVGTPVTCNQESDDEEWKSTVEALRILGPEHVLGVAIGNELDLLHTQPNNCSGDVWGYFKRNFKSRVESLLYLHGGAFANISVTTVTADVILKCGDPSCSPQNMTFHSDFADVLKFIHQVVPAEKYVMSLNLYPYFKPCSPLDHALMSPVFSCEQWTALAVCSDSEKCVVRQSLIATRLALERVLGKTGRNTRLWIGEIGWAAPQSRTLTTAACTPFKDGRKREICSTWSTESSKQTAYTGFLNWDLSVSPGMLPVELAFWFSVRDSNNFGVAEHFGLCGAPALPWWKPFGVAPAICTDDDVVKVR